MPPRLCAVIPTRNHYVALPAITAALRRHGLPVIIIDDGSDEPARGAIAALNAPQGGVEVMRLPENLGKGGAMAAGLRRAYAAGFTHALQVDADGQHDLSKVKALIEAAHAHPEALISGRPVYDASVPLGRRLGRWVTHVWVWIETLSLRIKDSMCGFRVYPLAQTLKVLDGERLGSRMEFDTEIMVRLFWRGVPVLHIPVKVVYPKGNSSNFRMLRDNWLLSLAHTRLVLAMLVRLPFILMRRPPVISPSPHWAAIEERGAYWGMRTLALAAALLGRRVCQALILPIAVHFYLTDASGRRHSLTFLRRAFAHKGLPPPSRFTIFRHYMSFAAKVLDTFLAWSRPRHAKAVDIVCDEELKRLITGGKGVLLLVSHLGNSEISRACLSQMVDKPLNVLLHTRHAVLYNRLIKSVRPDVEAHTIQVTELGPDTAIALRERVERGEWIAIAADRTPVMSQARTARARFLGHDAPFSLGPYILGALMDCPVYLMFCLREGGRHTAYFEPFAERIVLPRRNKAATLQELAVRYASRLEHYTLKDPLQWYNFYDFWAAASAGRVSAATPRSSPSERMEARGPRSLQP